MRLLSLFCYNPTISVDETTAHENIQGYYPPTVSLDEQTNEVGLCSAGVAIQDRFSACTGPITRTQLLHNQRPLVDRLLLDEETTPVGAKWPTTSAAQDAAASARALKIQRRSLTIGTKRFVIVPVEENFYIVAVLSRGHVSEATSLEGPHPRALRQRSGVSGRPSGSNDVRSSGADSPASSGPSTIAGTTAQEMDAFAKSRNQAPSGYKRHISAVTHNEDDVDDAVVDGVESYVRSYHDMFAMMYGTLTRNYGKIVQPLTKPMLRAMASDEERDAAKARRSEQTARFRSMVKVGLVAKLVPRLRRWLLGSPSDGASFLSPVGMELLGVSGPAALAVSSISGVLQNAHPGALCGVVAMADGKVFHSTVSSKDTSTLFRLVEHYCTEALDSEHDRIVNLAAAGPDRLQGGGGGSSRRPKTEAIPYRSRRTGTLENPNSNNAPLTPPISPIDDTWLMDSKRMLQAENERAQCFRRSVHFGKPGHRLVGMAGVDGSGGGSTYTPPSSAPMAAPLMGSAQRSAKRSLGAFDMTVPSMGGDKLEEEDSNQATRSSGVLMEQTAPRGAYRFRDPTPSGSTRASGVMSPGGHNPRDAFSAALLADDGSDDEEDMTDRGGLLTGRSSTASSFVHIDRPPQSPSPSMGGGGGERAGSFVFVDGVPMGVINCELESIQLLLLVHEKFLSIPQLQAGLVQSVEEVLESVNGSDQLLSYIRPAVAASTNSNFSKEFNYHYVNTMNHSVKSSIKTQLNNRMTMQLEEGINAGLQVLDSLGATGKKYQPSPQATSLIRSATLRATPLLSRTSDANPRSSGTVTPTGGGPPVEVSLTSRQVQPSLLGPASAHGNPVLSAYFYELQTLLRTMPPPPRAIANSLAERQAAAKLPRHASLLEMIPYTLHVSKPPHVFSETATLPLNQLDAIRNFIALQGSTSLTDGGRRGARQHHSMPNVTLISATALSDDDDTIADDTTNSPKLACGVENPLRDALARLGATTWCYYMAAEWREFCIVVEADSIITADRTIKSVVRAVFTGLHQDPL